MCFQLKVLQILGVGGLQVYGICSRRLVYSEVLETRSNYKKCYLWWFRNPACCNLTGSNRIEKDRIGVPPKLSWGEEGGGGIVGFSVCEAPLDDWASGGSVDVGFTYGESGFSSMEI